MVTVIEPSAETDIQEGDIVVYWHKQITCASEYAMELSLIGPHTMALSHGPLDEESYRASFFVVSGDKFTFQDPNQNEVRFNCFDCKVSGCVLVGHSNKER